MTFIADTLATPLKLCAATLLAASLFVLIMGPKRIHSLRERVFAWISANFFVTMAFSSFRPHKESLFAPLKEMESHSKQLKEEKAVRILEIGVGPGANFPYYPDKTKLVAVDPNPYFESYFNENCAKFPNVELERFVLSCGEDLSEVADGSVDAVVFTLVLCSVTDMSAVIREAKRVLTEGGMMFYLEHVADKEGSWARWGQDQLSRAVWPFLLGNCHLNRDPGPLIKSAGFSDVSHKQFRAEMKGFQKIASYFSVFSLVSPFLVGVARK